MYQKLVYLDGNLTLPETNTLIEIAKLYNTTLDYLLETQEQKNVLIKTKRYYQSTKKLFNKPLLTIDFRKTTSYAKGIIAIGPRAKGVISIGFLSTGIISLGVLSIGLLALGTISIELLALGAISLRIISLGAVAIGLVLIGAISIGYFSLGAIAIAKYVAIGDYAVSDIAIGKTYAEGNILNCTKDLLNQNLNIINNLLDTHIQKIFNFITKIIKHILKTL